MNELTWPEEVYRKTSVNNLILLGLWSLGFDKKVSFEQLLEQCFHLFPKKFSFPSCKKWPDSRKLDRQLRNLRAKKLIRYKIESRKVGGLKPEIFSLSSLGKKKAEQTLNLFRQTRLILK